MLLRPGELDAEVWQLALILPVAPCLLIGGRIEVVMGIDQFQRCALRMGLIAVQERSGADRDGAGEKMPPRGVTRAAHESNGPVTRGVFRLVIRYLAVSR